MALSIRNVFLYGFLDTAYLAGRDLVVVTRALITGGVDILQLRAKRLSHREITEIARRILPVTRAAGVPLIINDHVEIARHVDAAGVHLGQEDAHRCSVAAARDRLGCGKIIGLSTHSVVQARAAEYSRPDYIGFGPLFLTDTKPGRPAIGLSPVHSLHSSPFSLPVFCIGGINESNLDDVLAAGARRVAIVSAILCAPALATATHRFKQQLLLKRSNATACLSGITG